MKYSFHTHSRKMLGDLQTPVSIYLKVRDMYPGAALLESSDFHSHNDSLSFVALCPIAHIRIGNNHCEFLLPDGKQEQHHIQGNYTISDCLQDFLKRFEIQGEDKDKCGLFGYTAYDAIRYLEKIPIRNQANAENPLPDLLYGLYKYLLVFDHFKNELQIIELLRENEEPQLASLETIINNRNYTSYNFRRKGKEFTPASDCSFLEMVRKGIGHCLRGDVFQIVLSRQFIQPFQGDDFKVYRALRSINPSPYLFYFDFGNFRIFGSSPETHCKISNRQACIDPIAGTAFRSGDPATDQQRTQQLLDDPKENAEHVMLVDLARNDLSRNCNRVSVEFYKEIQYYSHVIHLVSRVTGYIREESSSIGTYLDTFPAGTLSGAPKVRAMQLINGIEPESRGIYGGCIGFIGLNGDLNQAITIRTFVSRGDNLYYQAGAGIVAQSNPERELQEVNNKLSALKKALEMAEKIIN